MRKKIPRFISAFMAVILVFSLVPSALASTGVDYKQKPDFWQWIAGKGSILHNLVGYTVGAVCPHSEDGYHHASNYDRLDTFFGGETGYYDCTCDYCGAEFEAYESDLQQSYDAQVEALPAQGVTSAGRLLWQPSCSDLDLSRISISSSMNDYGTPHSISSFPYEYDSGSFFVDFLQSADGFYVSGTPGVSSWVLGLSVYFRVPLDGTYGLIESPLFSVRVVLPDGSIESFDRSYSSGSYYYCSVGGFVSCSQKGSFSSAQRFSRFVGELYFPYYEIIPDSALDINSGDTYNIQSRPTSITGDYGIIGDNGQITKVDGDYIVNETTNNYHNPATGTTTPIVDWSYDYGDRTYSLTLEGELSAEVQYGDDHITINETTVNDTGDTVTNNYTIYYLVDGGGNGTEDPDPSPSPSPSDPPACVHTWTETSRTEPTCTTAGKVTSACSKCNQTKAETIPATGHTWVVERTVQTSYDEEGNLLQQGYTIYKCSVCGEEYKDMEGTGPPGEEEKKSIWEKLGDLIGSIFGGIGELIEAVLGKLLDALQSLADMLMGKLKSVIETVLSIFDEVPALFGGFLDFLGAIFPYLPPEITMLLTFGVVAVVFIGILKALVIVKKTGPGQQKSGLLDRRDDRM